MLDDRQRLDRVDTAGSVCWFLMDASWMLHFRDSAIVLAVPTILFAAYAFRYVERAASPMFVSGAMLSWACMNVAWMFHDLGVTGPDGIHAAGAFFITGAAQLVVALICTDAEHGPFDALFRRFRRMRFRRPPKRPS